MPEGGRFLHTHKACSRLLKRMCVHTGLFPLIVCMDFTHILKRSGMAQDSEVYSVDQEIPNSSPQLREFRHTIIPEGRHIQH